MKSMQFLFTWPQFIFSGQFLIIYAFTASWTLISSFLKSMSLWLNCYQLYPYHKNAAISMLFITQRAVKVLMIDNSPDNMNCGLVNKNFIDLIHFIDILKTDQIWPKQEFSTIGVTMANQHNSKIKKTNKLLGFFKSFTELYQCPK